METKTGSQPKNTIVNDKSAKLIDDLKEIMSDKGVSGNQLCRDTGVNKSQLSRFLNKKINVSLNLFINLVDALGYEIRLVSKHQK